MVKKLNANVKWISSMAIHPTAAEEIVTFKPWQPAYRALKD
jgi:hypothetical protein